MVWIEGCAAQAAGDRIERSSGAIRVANLTTKRIDRRVPSESRDRSTIRPADAVAGAASSIATATRLISETAHDLRSPMTAVREAVRLVRDGELGALNEPQHSLLSDAIDQCDCIDHLVGEMLTLDRLRGGPPRAKRRLVSLDEIRESVDQTLRPWAVPRAVAVNWTSAADPRLKVYVDPAALRRLLVNLAVNAIRVSPDGGAVMIDARLVGSGQAVRWSVIDRGTGMNDIQLRSIAAKQTSSGGGEGLGLMISRQLAALHFSKLSIQSMLGWGTAVSFLTPYGTPRAVAERWVQWRRIFRQPSTDTIAGRLAVIEQGTPGVRPPRSVLTNQVPGAIEISVDQRKPRSSESFSLSTLTLGAAMSLRAADRFDEHLQNQLDLFELGFRVGSRRWVCVVDVDQTAAKERFDLLLQSSRQEIENLRISLGPVKTLSLESNDVAGVLGDLLVRRCLSQVTGTCIQASDEVRLGTTPLDHSEYAAERLEREVRRLQESPFARSEIRQESRSFA